jgi:hypothetical protein
MKPADWLDAYDEAIAGLTSDDAPEKTLNVATDLFETFETVPGVDKSKVSTPITTDNAGDVLNEMYNEVSALHNRQRAGRRKSRKSRKTRASRRSRR